MADTNRVGVGLTKEVTMGVTPTSPVFQTKRITSAGAAPRLNSIESREIRADRQLTSLINTFTDATGEIAAEVSFGALDDLIEAALCTAWVQQASSAIASMSATAITLTGAVGANYKKGALVAVTGTVSNDGYYPLAAVGSGSTMAITGGTIETTPATSIARTVGIQGASGDVALLTGPNRLTISAATGVWTDFVVAAGDWVYIGGTAAANRFAIDAANGWARVSVVTATTLTFDRVPAGFAADAGTAKTIRVHLADKVTNGTTIITFTQKRQFQDITVYEYSKGMAVDRMTLGGQSGGILEATFAMEGTSGEVLTAAKAGETDVEGPAWNPVAMNANVGFIGAGTANNAAPNYSTRMQLTIANNIRKRIPIGFTSASSIGLGQFNCQLTLDTYFGDSILYAAVLGGLETTFAFAGKADAGGQIMVDCPRIRAASGTPSVPGINQDVMLPITYQLLRDPVRNYTIKFQRFWGTV